MKGTWGRGGIVPLLTLALEVGEWSALPLGRALPQGEGPLVPIVQESGWAPEPVWSQVRRALTG
jgi:hypothetical protein